jgi:hypothetical protein
VKRLLGAATVLLSISLPVSAATIAVAPTETGSMLAIGAGLVIAARVTRFRSKRG